MRKVKCEECGKVYNFDVDDFCPRCGAFNQPPKASAINADGSVIRLDGINEKNHAGSFVHEELHEENRERRRMGLSKGYAAYRSRQAAFFRRGHPAHRFPPCQADKCLRQSGRRDLQDHRRHHPSQYSLQLRQLFQIFSILMPPKPL